MTSHARTIMGGLESSLETLRILKRKMSDTSAPNHQMEWAIGSIVVTLTANLLRIAGEVIANTCANPQDDANALSDIREIQRQFNDFIERMVSGG